MRVDKGFRGSVTVFAAMSFMLIVSVILVLIDGARLQGARAMVGMAAQMALDSMFSGYEKELLDRYGVLLFDGANEGDELDEQYIADAIKNKLERELDMDSGLIFAKGVDFYGIEIDEVCVDRVIRASDAFGLIWRKSVNDYAKLEYTAQLLESVLGLDSLNKENETVRTAVDRIDDCMEQISEFYRKYLKLIECIDGIKTGSNGVNFDKLKIRNSYVKRIGPGGNAEAAADELSISDNRVYKKVSENIFNVNAFMEIFLGKFSAAIKGDNMNIKELKELGNIVRGFFGNMKQEIKEAMKLIEDIRGDEILISEKIAAAADYLGSITQISDESFEGLKESMDSVSEEREKILEHLGDVEKMYEVLENNYDVIEKVCDSCPSMFGIHDNGINITGSVSIYMSYSKVCELLVDYRTDSLWLDYSDVACRDGDGAVLGCLYDYSVNGLLSLVLPSGTEISHKSIGNLQLADLYGTRGDRQEYIDDTAADIMNEILFNLLIYDCYDNYADNDGQGLLDYELEYILFGKSSDKDNLKAAVMTIAGIRLGCNTTYILTDVQKKQEAYNIALAALGFTGIAALVKGLQYIILGAWAIGETIVDMRMLLAGKKIPIIKKKDDWRLSLDNLLGGKLDVSEERDDEDGLGYAQYLAAVMILRDAQDKAFRSMAVAEMHMISQGVSNFRLKNYVYGLDITVAYRIGNSKNQYMYKCSYTY